MSSFLLGVLLLFVTRVTFHSCSCSWFCSCFGRQVFKSALLFSIIDKPVDTSRNGTSDVTPLLAMQANGNTTISFRRKLLSKDVNDVNITSEPLYMIYAIGTSDGFGTAYAKHTETGSALVNFSITNGSALYVPPSSGSGGNTTNISLASLGLNASAPQFVSPDGVLKVWWAISRGNITFTVWGSTTGWLSVGLALTPFMPAADTYVVRTAMCTYPFFSAHISLRSLDSLIVLIF